MRKFLGFLIVLVVLLVGADFGLRYLATRQIGDAVQSRLDLPQRPDVSVAGFPFIVQAVDGRYDGVRATLPPTTLGPVAGVTAVVRLTGVRLPLSDAITGRVDRLTADTAQARLTIPVASVAAAVDLPELRITSENGALVLATTITALGQQFPVTARLDAAVTDSRLILRSGGVSGTGVPLPAEVVGAGSTLVDLAVPLEGLPFTVTSGAVSVSGTDVVVDAAAAGLDLAAR